MTATLNVRLHKYLGGANTEAGAVGQIYAIDDQGERDFDRDRRDLIIPAGYTATPLTVSLEPGRYIVEATLPSGDVANAQVKLGDDATLELNLEAKHSPHEWLSWQQYLGNVPPRPDDRSLAVGKAVPRRGRRAQALTQLDLVQRFIQQAGASEVGEEAPPMPVAPPPPPPPSEPEPEAPLPAPPLEPAPPVAPIAAELPPWPEVSFIREPVAALEGRAKKGSGAWRKIMTKAVQKDPVAALSSGPPTPVPARDGDQVRQVLTVGGDGPVVDDSRDPSYGSIPPRRYVVAVRPGGTIELACLPTPWDAGPFGRVPVEILVRRQPLPGEAMLAMSPRDPGIGSALGYVGTSNLQNARLVFDTAKDLLFGKMINALGAAAGGYVLLATEHGPGPHAWHDWIRNLADWFDWLPDGMIQYGHLRLQLRQSEADIKAARAAFFAAYDRGLPYYSLGLQWLADGLSLLASRDEAKVRKRLAAVQQVLWRANLAQPFTTLRLRD